MSAHDSGRIVNPTLAESQLEGGIIQGLGYALFEERVLDAAPGHSAQSDDARLQGADDRRRAARSMRSSSTTSDAVANHTGAKGLAEPPIIGVAAAIANAVADALGVRGHGDSADAVASARRGGGRPLGSTSVRPGAFNVHAIDGRSCARRSPVLALSFADKPDSVTESNGAGRTI